MPTDGSINLRIDKRNISFVARTGQPLGLRLNNILDRYAWLVIELQAHVLARFTAQGRADLALALKPLEARRVGAMDIRQHWAAGLPSNSDARVVLSCLAPLELLALVEAMEGQRVNLDREGPGAKETQTTGRKRD